MRKRTLETASAVTFVGRSAGATISDQPITSHFLAARGGSSLAFQGGVSFANVTAAAPAKAK